MSRYHHSRYNDGVHRIQVQLTESQERQVREMAGLRNVSISALIREGVDALVAPLNEDWERRKAAALAVIGSARSGRSDTAERHDDYLAEALHQEIVEKRP